MARFAALYFGRKTSRPLTVLRVAPPPGPTTFVEIVGLAGVGALISEVKRSVASHEDNKAPRFAGRVKMQRIARVAASYPSLRAISATRLPSALASWRSWSESESALRFQVTWLAP